MSSDDPPATADVKKMSSIIFNGPFMRIRMFDLLHADYGQCQNIRISLIKTRIMITFFV
jgi:hypothetical protein